MNTSEKAELTTSVRHIEKFSKSGTLIYNSEILPDVDRRIQAIAKRYPLQAKAIYMRVEPKRNKSGQSTFENTAIMSLIGQY